jgi:NTP pyrophosphatase (non-canonical NTP hydrolase)
MDIKTLTNEIEEVSKKYTSKFNIKRDDDWYILKLQEEVGELMQAYLMLTKRARQKDMNGEEIRDKFQKEVADVLGQILLISNNFKIDLEKVVEEKWLIWNKVRKNST